MLTSPLLTLLFVNYDGSMVLSIFHREKKRIGLLNEWISGSNTAAFNRHIVNTSVGAPLTDIACFKCTRLCAMK